MTSTPTSSRRASTIASVPERLARLRAHLARVLRAPTRAERAVLAILVGVAAGLYCWRIFHRVPVFAAKDWTYQWRAARAVLAGQNPYEVIRPTGSYPYESWYMYPFTATLVALPFGYLTAQLSGALFVASGAATFAYAVSRDGARRLWILVSAPFVVAVTVAQWTPLLTAAALLWPLGWVLACKPTIGAALFVYRPRWSAVVLGGALVAVALVVHPQWPLEWVRNSTLLRGHGPWVLVPFGWVPLLALLRWRRPDARLVAAMALVPQVPYFYDQLPLMLVARSGRSGFALAALSWVAWLAAMRRCAGRTWCGPASEPMITALVYVPVTLYVLLRREPATAPPSPPG